MATAPDPACPVCSKAIRSGSLVLFEHGELFHVACRSRTLERAAIEEVDRATVAEERAARLIEETTRRRATRPAADPRLRAEAGPCPVCGHRATVTDWHPGLDWVVVEGCSCGGFFVAGGVLTERLPQMAVRDREDLALRIRSFRAQASRRGSPRATTRRSGPWSSGPGGRTVRRSPAPDCVDPRGGSRRPAPPRHGAWGPGVTRVASERRATPSGLRAGARSR
jgi:hypothetical protein